MHCEGHTAVCNPSLWSSLIVHQADRRTLHRSNIEGNPEHVITLHPLETLSLKSAKKLGRWPILAWINGLATASVVQVYLDTIGVLGVCLSGVATAQSQQSQLHVILFELETTTMIIMMMMMMAVMVRSLAAQSLSASHLLLTPAGLHR